MSMTTTTKNASAMPEPQMPDHDEPSFADFKAHSGDGEVLRAVAEMLQRVASGQSIGVDDLEGVVVPVFVDLREDPVKQLAWFFPSSKTDYRAHHALNACRLAMYFGMKSGMDDGRVLQLGILGLLYDVGMWSDDMPAVLERRDLSVDELRKVEQAPKLGADLLEKLTDVDPLAARIALEHHERADGTGYPERTDGEVQHAYSRLFQIIDSFLGMIEPRPFRKAVSPVEAMQRLAVQAHRGYYFGPAFRDWLKVMGVYPVGSFLLLNSEDVALVVESGGDNLRKPKVRVICTEHLDFYDRPSTKDLATDSTFAIEGAFTKFPKV